jgi:Outer membrane lipoprotein carrier protein LolA-like
MIFGSTSPLKLVKIYTTFGLILAFLALQPSLADAQQATALQPSSAHNDALLKSVMAKLALVKEASATYTETRYLKLLNTPAESSGTLNYWAPDRFEKITLKPIEERMLVEKDNVILEDVARKKRQRLYIGQHPAMYAIVEGMRGALGGNLPQLRQFFSLIATGNPAGWTLQLVPLEATQRGYIRAIVVVGKDDLIDTMEIIQSDGDRAVMKLARAATK